MLLITGAHGNVGGALARQLSDAEIPARALVRRSAPLPSGIEPVVGDLLEPEAWADALVDVERVFLVWPADAQEAEPAVRALGDGGRRVVYLSTHMEPGSEPSDPITRGHRDVERSIEAHAKEWTFLRSGGIATNALGWADQVREGVVRWPYADAARSLVHEADLAAVALRAITTDDLVGRRPHLTGPEVLTQAEQVATIASVLGRPVDYVETSRDEARAEMLDWGWPSDMVDGALDAWASMVERPEVVSSDVEAILGRPARTFRQWVEDRRSAFE